MPFDCGFDISPPLTSSPADTLAWSRFLIAIQREFAADILVQPRLNFYEFQVGSRPRLPRDGTKFLTFSSRSRGGRTFATESYIRKVHKLARAEFGDRVRFWHGLANEKSKYSAAQINASIHEYGSDDPAPWSPDERLKNVRTIAEVYAIAKREEAATALEIIQEESFVEQAVTVSCEFGGA